MSWAQERQPTHRQGYVLYSGRRSIRTDQSERGLSPDPMARIGCG
jgi:hypothetical protein